MSHSRGRRPHSRRRAIRASKATRTSSSDLSSDLATADVVVVGPATSLSAHDLCDTEASVPVVSAGDPCAHDDTSRSTRTTVVRLSNRCDPDISSPPLVVWDRRSLRRRLVHPILKVNGSVVPMCGFATTGDDGLCQTRRRSRPGDRQDRVNDLSRRTR